MPVSTWLRRIFGSTSGSVAVSPPPASSVAAADAAAPPLAPPTVILQSASPNAGGDTLPPELPVALAPAVAPPLPSGPFGASLSYGWITDVGRVREHNEDSVYVFVAEQQSMLNTPPFGLFILADGMGGHHAGEVASAVACQTVATQLMEQAYLPLLSQSNGYAGDDHAVLLRDLAEVLAEAIQSANLEVYENTPGSGTTLTCAVVVGSDLLIGHVGDSRAYLRDAAGEINLLTNDHSMVKQLVDIGQLTPEEAAIHPRRNILYRAVGQGGLLSVDVQARHLAAPAQLLLCTDGLWGLVSDEMLWEIVTTAQTPQAACEGFVDAANAAGGNDNITAIVVALRPTISPVTAGADESNNLA